MVTHSREADGAGRIRPLNVPVPIAVEVDERDEPRWIKLSAEPARLPGAGLPPVGRSDGQGWVQVVAVEDRWRLDDEWWRGEPVCRMYWRVALLNGQTATIFYDLITEQWHRQGYV